MSFSLPVESLLIADIFASRGAVSFLSSKGYRDSLYLPRNKRLGIGKPMGHVTIIVALNPWKSSLVIGSELSMNRTEWQTLRLWVLITMKYIQPVLGSKLHLFLGS